MTKHLGFDKSLEWKDDYCATMVIELRVYV